MISLKKIRSLSCLLLVFVLLLSSLVSCDNGSSDTSDTPKDTDAAEIEEKDYAASIKLDMDSETVKKEVTVKSFVDGDTTHFFIDESVSANGILKARYLAHIAVSGIMGVSTYRAITDRAIMTFPMTIKGLNLPNLVFVLSISAPIMGSVTASNSGL